ncbi:vacuolar protein sorting-associated protein 13a [Trichinella spiralis]|uniref:vacuolar protein sorting-associated protein 13a n=1 Tax=Trichinella spiralis TaxID=6334 RepID=UPI0001EFDDCF|nr:vacuolar protein sorting-associated protein 13a [Trichinella spiralis]
MKVQRFWRVVIRLQALSFSVHYLIKVFVNSYRSMYCTITFTLLRSCVVHCIVGCVSACHSSADLLTAVQIVRISWKKSLRKFLGAYVENLDASKMNFAIWSGNVVLNDLRLKASSLFGAVARLIKMQPQEVSFENTMAKFVHRTSSCRDRRFVLVSRSECW